jgi:hypothetical protein
VKFYTRGQVPTLQDTRGRIVIVNRDHALGSHYGITWNWPDADRGIYTQGRLFVEDNYKDVTSSAKEANIKRGLDKATGRAAGDTTWYATFLSCAPGNASPESWAEDMNAYASAYIQGANPRAHFGTVIMDFPPQELVDKILYKHTGV